MSLEKIIYSVSVPVIQLGVTHRNVSNAELAKLNEAADPLLSLLNTDSAISGAILLATCNRFEIYVDAKNLHPGVEIVRQGLAKVTDDSEPIAQNLQVRSGQLAVQHLFEVTCGLDAVVVGENEVAGQVRRALTAYSQTANSRLTRLFQAALTTSKTVANNTRLGANGRSLASVGLDLVDQRHAGVAGRKTLVLGTGDYAGVVVAELTRRRAEDIRVYSASGRSRAFADSHPQVTAVEEKDFNSALSWADLIVCCSGSSTPLITVEQLNNINFDQILPIIDLALSGDVEKSVRYLDQVAVIDLDEIAANVDPRQAEATEQAKQIVKTSAETFTHAEQGRKADPAVIAIRSYVSQIIDNEIAEATRHHSPETSAEIAHSLRRVSNSLLHTPCVRANEWARNGDIDTFENALNTVFGIEVEVS